MPQRSGLLSFSNCMVKSYCGLVRETFPYVYEKQLLVHGGHAVFIGSLGKGDIYGAKSAASEFQLTSKLYL